MKSPYAVTSKILGLCTQISEQIGMLKAHHADIVKPRLRKENKIKTIHNTLKIEGNTLSEEQVSTILDQQRVIGKKDEIQEVINANQLYESIDTLDYTSIDDFLKAHQILMQGLIETPGKLRTSSVGIAKGDQIQHIAPPHNRVRSLVQELLHYLRHEEEHLLIKSCVLHYEIEFIHPFTDGNGRIGRFWQTLILKEWSTVFKTLPFESIIAQKQKDYYKTLAQCDQEGQSTAFIEFMLQILLEALETTYQHEQKPLNQNERLAYFEQKDIQSFSRKEYMDIFPEISTATASRDLQNGVKKKLFKKVGEKNQTRYKMINND